MNKKLKFKVEYEVLEDEGYYRLYIRRRRLYIFKYWDSISSSTDINYTRTVRDNLIKLNSEV